MNTVAENLIAEITAYAIKESELGGIASVSGYYAMEDATLYIECNFLPDCILYAIGPLMSAKNFVPQINLESYQDAIDCTARILS